MAMSEKCAKLPHGEVLTAISLLGFFGFLRLSNLAPHSLASFDHTRHLTGEDVFFTKKFLKVIIKWSKTMQTRDRVQCLTWSSDCVWQYIQSNHESGEYLAKSLATNTNAI